MFRGANFVFQKLELAIEMPSYMAMTSVSLQKVSSLEENIIKQISHM
jgi:hypothetical protein